MPEHTGPLAPDAPSALTAIRQHITTEFDLLGNSAHAILRTAEGEIGQLFGTVLDRYSRLEHLVARLEHTLELVLEHDRQCNAQTPATITLTAQEKA